MNFEAFQAQQKAQKDEERMRKNQAAEGLRNYQAGGLSEEDTKATAMKEQERQHKLDAERLLRGYRGTLSEEDHKLAALREEERRRKLEAKEQLRGYGVVSGTQDSSPAIVPGAVSEMAGKINVVTTEPAIESNAETVMVGTPSHNSRPVDVVAAPAESTVDNGNAQLETQDNAPPTNISAPSSPSKMYATFMFGLISAEENVSVDGYLIEIDRIATTAIGDTLKQAMAFEYPSVESIEKDAMFTDPAGRQEVGRSLVTISIPFVATDPAAGETARVKIIETIRLEIHNGTFKKQLAVF